MCNIKGHQILFEPICEEDYTTLSNLLLHNYIPDQTLFRALGSGKRLQDALSNPEVPESQAFLRETHGFLKHEIICPCLESKPIVSFKAVCETTGEIIGVSFGKAVKPSDNSADSLLRTG